MIYKKVVFGVLLISLFSGCALTPPVKMSLVASPKSFVENKLKEKDYPGYMAGAGNIYSCRYGIYYKNSNEFTPSRDKIFESLLFKYLPKISKHKVSLTQFDVYYNKRLKQLNAVAPSLGGGIITDIAMAAAERGHYGFMSKNFLIDSVPKSFPLKTDEVVVGCDDANEGEYYPSRVSGGHDVVVSWFTFSVGRKTLRFRTLYQFQPESKDDIQKGISIALDRSIKEIAARLNK